MGRQLARVIVAGIGVLLLLAGLTSCGSSDPVILRGTIEPHGPAVWARVHGEPYIGDIAAQETTNGEFELRGEVPADQARTLCRGRASIGT
jgi:hypothetical protein